MKKSVAHPVLCSRLTRSSICRRPRETSGLDSPTPDVTADELLASGGNIMSSESEGTSKDILAAVESSDMKGKQHKIERSLVSRTGIKHRLIYVPESESASDC
jgi:hypothetical protein